MTLRWLSDNGEPPDHHSFMTIGAGPSYDLVLARRSDSKSDERSIYLLLTVAKRLKAGFY
jgi:hypothetical protein